VLFSLAKLKQAPEDEIKEKVQVNELTKQAEVIPSKQNNITSEELNKSKEEDLMDLHKMGLTLNSDEIEFLKSRGKKVSVKSL
jgi:hypothetical protein